MVAASLTVRRAEARVRMVFFQGPARVSLSTPNLQAHIALQLGQLVAVAAVAAVAVEYLTWQTNALGALVEDLLVKNTLGNEIGAALVLGGLPSKRLAGHPLSFEDGLCPRIVRWTYMECKKRKTCEHRTTHMSMGVLWCLTSAAHRVEMTAGKLKEKCGVARG